MYCSNRVFIEIVSRIFSVPVIEVASGEYGDWNPVLFEAAQGGMCAIEEKKNSCDKKDTPAVCPTKCLKVSINATYN